MEVLILVMSSRVGDYPKLEKVQRETWDSVKVKNIKTIYYLAGDQTKLEEDLLYIKGGEEPSEFFTRTKLALKHMLNYNWDYVFKTDNSAYVDKIKLLDVLSNLPKNNLYAGKLFHDKKIVSIKDNFMWGEGYVLSRDLAKYITNQNSGEGMVDDVWVAELLKDKVNFVELPFYDYFIDDRPLKKVHLYRCKSSKLEKSITAMTDLFQYLNL